MSAADAAADAAARDRRSSLRATLVVAAVAFIVAVVATTPSLIALINWDNGAYIVSIASHRQNWSGSPGYWNAHFGILQAYLVGWWIVRVFGGTVIDGFRLVTAVAYAATCAVLFFTARRMTGRALVAGALTAVWATAWVDFHYLLILEDNPLFLAPAAAAVCWCALFADRWRWRASIVSGALCCVAFIFSWQALPYLFLPAWTALLSPRRSFVVRVRDAALVPAAALVSLFAFVAFMAATSTNRFADLVRSIFSPPSSAIMPHTMGETLKQLVDGNAIVQTLGNAVAYHATFNAYQLPHGPPAPLPVLGTIAAFAIVVIFAFATVWSWREKKLAAHVVAAMLLVLAYLTAIFKDVPYTALKRFDFVPLLVVALAMIVLGDWQARRPSSRRNTIVAAILIALSVAQLGFGLRWTFHQRAGYAKNSPYGRDGKSWFDFFRSIRRAHPSACTYVLALGEIHEGNWNLDIPGALWSELPRHLALATDGDMASSKPDKWRYPVTWSTVRDAKEKSLVPACAWVSDDARALLR